MMVINRSNMNKRKRKDGCNFFLDDSPKRTKVHAQRKFAQGSNMSSPVITPIKEIERQERPKQEVIPEPTELLPTKRPNTEDFLTFLCFRGTPILPPSLNFFNTATGSYEKPPETEEEQNNGPIATGPVTKSINGTGERPFIAFGVRKRADPVVISKQMDKKRRHALALQALRRKYQEQRLAKIRAVTINSLSEKVGHKPLVRTTRSISKTETVTKKDVTEKVKYKVVEKRVVKVPPKPVKLPNKPRIKPKMCLRSFRGRFVHHELNFKGIKKKPPPTIKVKKKEIKQKRDSDFSSDDDQPLVKTVKKVRPANKAPFTRIIKKTTKKTTEISLRITRSTFTSSVNKIALRRQQMKQQLLLTKPPIKNLRLVPRKNVKKPQPTQKKPETETKPTKPTPPAKKTVPITRSSKNLEVPKKKTKNEPSSAETTPKIKDKTIEEPAVTQRPTRKTKEAAAIYMEILGHKLVNDGKKDDDNVSIDSFPELPNVRKTEQRENELKAKAKVTDRKIVDKKQEEQKKVGSVFTVEKKKDTSSEQRKVSEIQTVEKKKDMSIEQKKVSSVQTVEKKRDMNTEQKKVSTTQIVEKNKDVSVQQKKVSKVPTAEKKKDTNVEQKKVGNIQTIEKKRDVSVEQKKISSIQSAEKKKDMNIEQKKVSSIQTIQKKRDGNVEQKKVSNVQTAEKKRDASIEQKKVIGIQPLGKKRDASVEQKKVSSIQTVEKKRDASIEQKKVSNIKTVEKTSTEQKKVGSTQAVEKKKDACIEQKRLTNTQTVDKKKDVSVEKKVSNIQITEKKKDVNIDQKKDSNIQIVERKKDVNSEQDKVGSIETPAKNKIVDQKKITNIETVEKKKDVNIEQKQISNFQTVDKKKDASIDQKKASIPKDATPSEQKKVEKKIEVSSEPKKIVTRAQSSEADKNNVMETRGGKIIRKNVDSNEKTEAVPVEKKPQVPKKTKIIDDSDSDILSSPERPRKKILITKKIEKTELKKIENLPPKKQIKSPKPITYSESQKKESPLEHNFNDSDEEPLSKLTQSKITTNKKLSDNKTSKKSSTNLDSKKQTNQKPIVKTSEEKEIVSEKPKRECTKKQQNYHPMFSSSDDEDKLFHGFVKTESENKPAEKEETACAHPLSADLLRRDVGRRFGKGKVNMSNEQIEKWLKESALAGTSIKKEDDEMLKFGEKLPTETLLESSQNIDTDSLKSSLLQPCQSKKEIKQEPEQSSSNPAKQNKETAIKNKIGNRTPITDRKPIFRKEKNSTPNVNAFSANNESSVYAFGEENEDVINTPFRRPNRRPSSTATSRSEDEGSKSEDMGKNSGKFRLPAVVKPETVKATNKQEVSQMLSAEEASSASIAVQVNLESSEPIAENVNIECATQTDTEDNEHLFYIPLQPIKQQPASAIQGVAVKLGTEVTNVSSQRVVMKAKLVTQTPPKVEEKPANSMFPPTHTLQKSKILDKSRSSMISRNLERNSESSEDFKYKVPSSPSASSSSSTKICNKRHVTKPKSRSFEILTPIVATAFPRVEDPAHIVEAPTFHPTDKEFQDPIEYMEKIRVKAEKFGICRIVPPSTFKPECKVSDDMRFTAYNQYVHKMWYRWGPNFKELMAIKKYLETQNITLTHPPWIGGMEIDLPRLYQTVQSLGGLKEVIEKKKWSKVSEAMKIPKSAQDRVTKLDDIYCKYLLPYDTLSPAEREKLFDEVETEWAKRESRTLQKVQQKVNNQTSNASDSDSESDNEAEECIVKGRNMALNGFYRIARNTMSMWFRSPEPPAQEVEQEFWKHVSTRTNHICVHSGSIDCGNWGYGFAVSKNSPFARNAWNLKVLTNNSGSVLRSMGPVMGVTVPTLHVGMLFSACCWYRDPHHLPWIEYLHTGANKIWYGIPDSMSDLFHTTLLKLVPNYCRNKSLWLPSDTAMVPPSILVENGVSLCRTVQEPGQFVVVFPKAFTCSISTGYVVSESVYYAPPNWLGTAQNAFDELRNSCEPSMFSLERLIVSIVVDVRSNVEVLKGILPAVERLCGSENATRTKLRELGVREFEKLPLPDAPGVRKRKKLQDDDSDYECEDCRKNLFLSMVSETQEDLIYCLDHGMEHIKDGTLQSANCKLLITYDDGELAGLVDRLKATIESKQQKKVPGKFSGMPTLLK